MFNEDFDYDRISLWIPLCVSGMMFGGIHCLGWNYLFQAHEEQILWRVASVGLAFSPLIGTFMPPILMKADLLSRLEYNRALVLSSIGVSICFYSVSRLATVLLMMQSFGESLPPGAYDTVAWTEFIPHVNL
jgi:hypothetical protein